MSHDNLKNLTPYDLHKTLINQYFSQSKSSSALLQRSHYKTDYDVIRENHKFLWDEKDEKNVDTWEKKLAKKYYDKLYREYCIADLSRYKENKFGLRWRTEQELICGRGQFSCGNKKCTNKEELRTWEVNFAYEENGERRNALVKLRLCPDCSRKLNYTHKKKEVKRLKGKRKMKDKSSSLEKVESDKKVTEDVEDKLKKENESEAEEADALDIWKSKDTPEEEKSREEEFEEYLEELFL